MNKTKKKLFAIETVSKLNALTFKFLSTLVPIKNKTRTSSRVKCHQMTSSSPSWIKIMMTFHYTGYLILNILKYRIIEKE